MTAPRRSVYDGRDRLGDLEERDDGIVARDRQAYRHFQHDDRGGQRRRRSGGCTMTTRYRIVLEPRRGVDGVKAIRRLLKHAGRYLGLRAVDAREEYTPDVPNQVADALVQLHHDVRNRLRGRS